MRAPFSGYRIATAMAVAFALVAVLVGQESPPRATRPDAVQEAQSAARPAGSRPEQQKSAHDKSDAFAATKAPHSSTVLPSQPQAGEVKGFDFRRDPLDSKRPMQPAREIVEADVAAKAKVMADQRRLLETRYTLQPRTDPNVKMSRGKPVPIGPTARLAKGLDWDALAAMAPDEIKRQGAFPYPPLPHPKHATGGQVFPEVQTKMFPRLVRFEVVGIEEAHVVAGDDGAIATLRQSQGRGEEFRFGRAFGTDNLQVVAVAEGLLPALQPRFGHAKFPAR